VKSAPKAFIADRALITERMKECIAWTAIGVFLTFGVINALILMPALLDHHFPLTGHPQSVWSAMLDSNGDEHPDVIKTYIGNQLVRIDSDRNFDGQVDLIQKYSHGMLVLEIHDDDFDGKPEAIKEFADGKVAIIERDPDERGRIDTVEYYDDKGKLIARKNDTSGPALPPMPRMQ
jgi:hypothetical protein